MFESLSRGWEKLFILFAIDELSSKEKAEKT